MRSIRLLTAVALFLPTLAQAQFYYMPAPSTGVSRASFVEMVMSRVGNSAGGTYCFKDVKQQSYASAVCGAKGLGIVTGDASTKFRPDDAISFVEAAAVAIRASGNYVQGDSLWYRPYLNLLSDWNAFPSSITNIFYPISSSQAQELIGNVFNADHTSNSHTSNTSSNSTSTTDSDSSDDVKISVKVSDTRADIGDTVTYTITIKNEDNNDIENLDVRATIDSDFDYVSSSDSGDYTNDRIDWDNIDINENESETLTLKLRVSGGANDGDKLSFRVKADDSEVRKTLTVDENANSNNSRNKNDLRISVSDSPTTAKPGDTVTYTIKLENNDNSDMRVDVRASLDSDMTFVSASDNGDENNDRVDWDNILVRKDDTETISLKVRINSSAKNGDTVRLDVESEGEKDSETTEIKKSSSNNSTNNDISISISDTPDPVGIGEVVTYTIRLENNSNDDQEVDVVAYLDEGMTIYTSSDLSERVAKEVRWRDLFIPKNGYRTVNIKVRANSRVSDGDTIQLRVDVDDASEEESTRIRN